MVNSHIMTSLLIFTAGICIGYLFKDRIKALIAMVKP